MRVLFGWALNAAVLMLLPYVLPAVQIHGFVTALLAALIISLLNTLVRPVLVILTLPVTILSLGLFLLVLNGLSFWMAAQFLPGFEVTGFGWAVIAAIAYSILSSLVASVLLRSKD